MEVCDEGQASVIVAHVTSAAIVTNANHSRMAFIYTAQCAESWPCPLGSQSDGCVRWKHPSQSLPVHDMEHSYLKKKKIPRGLSRKGELFICLYSLFYSARDWFQISSAIKSWAFMRGRTPEGRIQFSHIFEICFLMLLLHEMHI